MWLVIMDGWMEEMKALFWFYFFKSVEPLINDPPRRG